MLHWCACDRYKGVDGHALRMDSQGGQLVDQAHSIFWSLPKTNDTARTHADAGGLNICKRIQPILQAYTA